MKHRVQFRPKPCFGFIALILGAHASSVLAAGGRQQFPFAGGTVMVVDKKTITIQGFNGSRTVNVTDKTRFVKTVDAKLTDAKKGAKVLVIGQPSEDGKTIEADGITINPMLLRMRAGGGRRGVFGGFTPTRGEVTSALPLTVKTEDGRSVVIKTTAETKVSAMKDAMLADVKKGEFVMAAGKSGVNGSIDAETVRIGGGFGRGRPTASNTGRAVKKAG